MGDKENNRRRTTLFGNDDIEKEIQNEKQLFSRWLSTKNQNNVEIKNRIAQAKQVINALNFIYGPGGSNGKALDYGLEGPGSILGVGGVLIFLHTFVSRLVLGSTQAPIK